MNRVQKIANLLKACSRSEPIFRPFFSNEESGYDDFYPPIDSDKIQYEEDLDNVYCGKKVCWIGDKGKMMKVDSNYIYAIHGNEFYADKLESLSSMIASGEREYLYAPYGIMSIVDIDMITESLEYDGFGYEHGALTTGDPTVDNYLINKDNYDEEEAEELEELLRYAIKTKQGDIGKQIVQIRDGNHRAFAAIAAGEDYVWVKMYDNQYQDISEGRPWASEYSRFLS